MLYFIIQEDSGRARYEQIDYKGNTDELQHFLKRCGINIQGVFGREEYAKVWTDYYNGVITRYELEDLHGF